VAPSFGGTAHPPGDTWRTCVPPAPTHLPQEPPVPTRIRSSIALAHNLLCPSCRHTQRKAPPVKLRWSHRLAPIVLPLIAAACGGESEAPASKEGNLTSGNTEEAACSALEALPESHKPHWAYHGEEGPSTWGELEGYGACGEGQAQSPINISTADAVPGGAPLEFNNYDRAIPLKLKNNGHALEVAFDADGADDHPCITYEQKKYFLLQLHMHSTSEHTVDGESSLMEVHFVHQAEDGALAVVGVLFDEGEPSGLVQTMLDNEPGAGSIWQCSESVELSAIVPSTRGFYHYDGSLTTPPCSEGLNWFVMSSHQTVSAEQAIAYRSLFHDATTNRPVQELHGRTIEVNLP